MNFYFVLNLSGTLNCEIRRVSRNQMLYWKNAQWEIRFRFLSLETRKLFAEQCILHEISRDILRTNLLFIVPSKRLHHRAHNVPFTSAWMCSVLFSTSGTHLFCPETSAGAINLWWRQGNSQACMVSSRTVMPLSQDWLGWHQKENLSSYWMIRTGWLLKNPIEETFKTSGKISLCC